MTTQTNEIRLLLPDDCWFQVPGQHTARYFPLFREVGTALHAAMRELIPSFYFRESERYADTRYALPMLVYQSSKPFQLRLRDYYYDVLNPKSMEFFFRSARRRLFGVIGAARCCVIAAELKKLPRKEKIEQLYDAANANKVITMVRLHSFYRKPMNQMLVIEGRLLEELMKLSACGSLPPKARAKRIADFNHAWGVLLRRFCGSTDFNSLAPALLEAATKGLRTALRDLDSRDEEFDLAA